MITFIGGPARTGKTLITKNIRSHLNTSAISTDNLREAAIELDQIPKGDPLFTGEQVGNWPDVDRYYSKYSIEEIMNHQLAESKEVAKLVQGFVYSCDYNGQDMVVEGIALLPSLYSKEFLDKYGVKFITVGNTSLDTFIEYSWKFRSPGDWLDEATVETFNKVIEYSYEYSKIFQEEALERNIPFFDIESTNFESDVDRVVSEVIQYTHK